MWDIYNYLLDNRFFSGLFAEIKLNFDELVNEQHLPSVFEKI